MTATALAESLAHLVWESFSDDLADRRILDALPLSDATADGPADPELAGQTEEELLILHLWVHTRATQLGLLGRCPETTLRDVLDNLHRAVFEDMVDNGTPRSHLPTFERRLSGRYEEYYAAVRVSDEQLVGTIEGNLAGGAGWAGRTPNGPQSAASREAARMIHERMIEIFRPLRDYLDEVEVATEE